MSCYFRHLTEIFKKAGIKVTPENKKELDRIIHQLVKTEYKDCPKAWKNIKTDVMSNPVKIEQFAVRLKKAVKNKRRN